MSARSSVGQPGDTGTTNGRQITAAGARKSLKAARETIRVHESTRFLASGVGLFYGLRARRSLRERSPAMSGDTTLREPNFTIKQFCEAEGFSVPHYFKLRRMGRGPRELRIGAVVRITAEARRDFHRANENLSGALAAAQAEVDAGLRRRALAALGHTPEMRRGRK